MMTKLFTDRMSTCPNKGLSCFNPFGNLLKIHEQAKQNQFFFVLLTSTSLTLKIFTFSKMIVRYYSHVNREDVIMNRRSSLFCAFFLRTTTFVK